MPTIAKNSSPMNILTELALEGTASLVEADRALLDFAKQECDILLKGVKERVVSVTPAVAMTDLVRRSIDVVVAMNQELLTLGSKQAVGLLQPERKAKDQQTSQLIGAARDATDIFAHAQKNFLDAISEESQRAISKHPGPHSNEKKRTQLKELAREAGEAFIEAQKRLIDVMGQQMNVNVEAATRAADLISPAKVIPIAKRAREEVKDFFESERSLVESAVKGAESSVKGQPKQSKPGRGQRKRTAL